MCILLWTELLLIPFILGYKVVDTVSNGVMEYANSPYIRLQILWWKLILSLMVSRSELTLPILGFNLVVVVDTVSNGVME